MKTELKILFYLKKQSKKNGLSPVMGRIRIDKSMSQFSLKVNADAKLWDSKAGRLTGKSRQAQKSIELSIASNRRSIPVTIN